jgi:hypothetical protein
MYTVLSVLWIILVWTDIQKGPESLNAEHEPLAVTTA